MVKEIKEGVWEGVGRMNSNNEQMHRIEKRFKDELGENLNEDDKEVIRITNDFEEASRKLSLLINGGCITK